MFKREKFREDTVNERNHITDNSCCCVKVLVGGILTMWVVVMAYRLYTDSAVCVSCDNFVRL